MEELQLDRALVLGRRSPRRRHIEGEPFNFCGNDDEETLLLGGDEKLIIAPEKETSISRIQAMIRPVADSKVEIINASKSVPIVLNEVDVILPRRSSIEESNRRTVCAFEPVEITFNDSDLKIHIGQESSLLQSSGSRRVMTLAIPTLAPGQVPENASPLRDNMNRHGVFHAKDLAEWLLKSMSEFHQGKNARDFLRHATDSMQTLFGLDYVAGLTFDETRVDDRWQVEYDKKSADSDRPSRQILDELAEEKRPLRYEPQSGRNSLDGVFSIVAAPILNKDGKLRGALYGDSRNDVISELEMMVVQLVASGIANGMARLDQQEQAIRADNQFSSFFGSELAQELKRNPKLLEGREAEVSILFCDIRGFSSISDRVGPAKTLEWINDVLEVMSTCVVDHGGILVDYVGDELMAMWGAPRETKNHANAACLAAIEMRKCLSKINRRWEAELGQATEVGVGINSGFALVGNTGSQQKVKYGPLGTVVNLASRVGGVTKMVRRQLLVTGDTWSRLNNECRNRSRRLCTVEVVNIPEPVDIYEIAVEADEAWQELKAGYECALEHFEKKDIGKAITDLIELARQFPDDEPTEILRDRAAENVAELEENHPVWRLPTK